MITKDRIEKWILRKAFDTSDDPSAEPYLPDEILWRQKEQFSDGVGYGWIDALKDNAELHVTDEMMKNPKPEWGNDIPDTKEAYVFLLLCLTLDLANFLIKLLVPYDVRRAFPSSLRFHCDAMDPDMVKADRS